MGTDGGPKAGDAAPAVPPVRAADLARRRRARNWALLIVLLGLSALFYAITLVKLTKGG
jgi:hypothetical protein